jgi:hypothetical protein
MESKRMDGSETEIKATSKVSENDGDHHADGFENIGVLAKRILSRAKEARKETEELNAAASSVNFASGSIGGNPAGTVRNRNYTASQRVVAIPARNRGRTAK